MAHIPVLADDVLNVFSDLTLHTFVDATVGAGGHSLLILEAHPEITQLIAIDRDIHALEIAKKTLAPFLQKVTFVHAPFSALGDYVEQADGILLDIGVSSMQLDEGSRGFSLQQDGPLDMRMDVSAPLTAKNIVNRYSEKALGDLFREFGEERKWRQAAKAICTARRKKPIETTQELVTILKPVLGSFGKIHPATRIFQAIRIEVNQELSQLDLAITSALSLLNPGGRLAIITFHSLEDRIVKHRFKEEKGMKVLTKKPITASRQEQKMNRRSRSAKLRALECLSCCPDL